LKLEQHSAETSKPTQTPPPSPDRKRPVLIYIMILFIAAFLLMAMSFLMHRRSNEQVLGELHTSVNLLDDYQQALETNNQLTKQVSQLEEALSATKDAQSQSSAERDTARLELDAARQQLSALQQQLAALEALAKAQALYQSGDYTACQAAISAMETAGQDKLLSTAALELFQQLKSLDFPES